ncbi:aminotransferase class IV [Chitinivibrio alkaliphilus]|uniref:4-amino-4-deoxychorismate lyase n=1 Tax=Chitinivibrio alkaliphilus ACht1 TaxID=1313304 RepID=U7DAP2_9BACT|nr:aminotransferase class IV [Chitinivibrio alkaliphilus]ERP32197.1 4-amino-4-deoxychorismate lyase [Chitinivibrio alkaliphilus ACht1]
MSLLIESIRLEEGEVYLIDYHQGRLDDSRMAMGWTGHLSIEEELSRMDLPRTGIHKIRLLYGSAFVESTCTPYTHRPIRSLRVVRADSLTYPYKYADRTGIEQVFAQRRDCDDVICIRHGVVTDSSYCTLCFGDGTTWYTPDTPLLPGVMRQFLLDQGILKPRRITVEEIPSFQAIGCINAMRPLERTEVIPCSAVAGLDKLL